MEFMGTKEASEKWNVSQTTVAKWCRERKIPYAEQDAKGSPWRIPANAQHPQTINNKEQANEKN